MADALALSIAAAPEQWYSFKPIWPATAEEAADLERRAPPDAGRHAGPRPAMTRRGVGSWLRGRLLIGGSWLVCHLPEAPLIRAAELAGDAWYRFAPDRAAQARRNLRRVAVDLAARERGSAAARAAATDPRALERLVKRAFRHAALYYLEVARTPALGPGDIDRLMLVETPDVVDAAFSGGPVIFVGLHFGAIELPALLLASRVGGAVAPMELIDDQGLQDWFVRTRGAAGVRIVGLRAARRELLAALRAGSSVGLVGDRDLTGGGTLTTLFGAPAALPLGPAMLAVEADVQGVRRRRAASRSGSLSRSAGAHRHPARRQAPRTGHRDDRGDRPCVRAHRRGRARAVVGGLLPDLARSRGGRGGGAGSGAGGPRRMSDPDRPGRADLHIHTVASDGTADVVAILDHVAARGDLDVIAITDHERIDAALAAQAIAADRGLGVEVVVGEEVTTLGGHLLALYLDRPIRPYRSLRSTIAAVHAAGGLAIPAHPLVPFPLCAQGWVIRRLLDDPDPDVHPDAIEAFNPTALGRPWHARVVRFAEQHGLARVGNSDAHALDAIGSGLDDLRRPDGGRPSAGDRDGRDDARWLVPRHGRPGRGVRAAAAQTRAGCTRRGRRPAAAGRHRARPRLPGWARATAALRARGAGRGAPTGWTTHEDRSRLPVHLPRERRGRAARPLPVREPAPARPRRPDHHRQPRTAALVRGRHHPARRRVLRADQRVRRDADVLAALPRPDRRHAGARTVRRPALPRAVHPVPVAVPAARIDQRQHRHVPRVRGLLAVVRVRQPGPARVRRAGSTAASR